MKIDKNNFGWLFTCVGLVILLGISIYLGISGFFFQTEDTYTTDLVLGQNIESAIRKNQATSISVNMSGGFLPEERLAQVVSIKNLELDNSLYLRAKVFIYSSQNQTEEIDVVENSNWTKNEDGYYYYNELLSPLEKANFSTFIIAPSQDFVTASWKKYIVTFVFESLDSSVDVENLWQNNPVQNV